MRPAAPKRNALVVVAYLVLLLALVYAVYVSGALDARSVRAAFDALGV